MIDLIIFSMLSRIPPIPPKVSISACIAVGVQATLLVQMGMENSSLNRQLGEIRSELTQRNRYVQDLCQKYKLPTQGFFFNFYLKEEIPDATACIVEKGYTRESFVITRELLPSFRL